MVMTINLRDVANRLNRPINRGEVRDNCPLCGGTSRSKVQITEDPKRGLRAYCHACEATTKPLLTAWGLIAPISSVRQALHAGITEDQPTAAWMAMLAAGTNARSEVYPDLTEPEPDLRAPEDAIAPLPPLTTEDARAYLTAISTPGMSGRVQYRNADGREATHVRSLGIDGRKRAITPGLKGSGWHIRLWIPADLPEDAPVFLTEGEKDAATFCIAGYAAASSPGGAGRARSVIIDALLDLGRPIIIAQDNDKAGRKWSARLVWALREAGADVSLPDPTSLPGGDSIADHPDRWAAAINASRSRSVEGGQNGTVDEVFTHPATGTPTVAGCVKSPKVRSIPEPDRPEELACQRSIIRRGTLATGEAFGHPLPCGKCERCLTWWRWRRWHLWQAGGPMPGQQTIVEFTGLKTLGEVRRLLHSQRGRLGQRQSPAFWTARPMEVERGPGGSEQVRLAVTILYRDGLSEQAVALTSRWADRKAVICSIQEGQTVSQEWFDSLLIRRRLTEEDGSDRKNMTGFWRWPARYQDSAPAYLLGDDATRSSGDGGQAASEPEGPAWAVRRWELQHRNVERAAEWNARDWMSSISAIAWADWERVLDMVGAGEKGNLPGYAGPWALLRDAALAWQGRVKVRSAHQEVLRLIQEPTAEVQMVGSDESQDVIYDDDAWLDLYDAGDMEWEAAMRGAWDAADQWVEAMEYMEGEWEVIDQAEALPF